MANELLKEMLNYLIEEYDTELKKNDYEKIIDKSINAWYDTSHYQSLSHFLTTLNLPELDQLSTNLMEDEIYCQYLLTEAIIATLIITLDLPIDDLMKIFYKELDKRPASKIISNYDTLPDETATLINAYQGKVDKKK